MHLAPTTPLKVMHPRTIATLRRLEKAAWFSCVGVKDTKVAIVLSSWDEAVEHCGALEWADLRLEATNQYCERLFARSRERFSKWNEVVVDVTPATMDLVNRKLEPVVREHDLPEMFGQSVAHDIFHLCMEAEYADVCPPAFFAGLAHWYDRGRFPCGWRGGIPPQGNPVVY
jgi:hypothetical protein